MSLLRIQATLAAPVVVSDDLHFDGLLMTAHPIARAAHVSRETPLDQLPAIPLPLQRATLRAITLPLASAAVWPAEAKLSTDHTVKRRDAWDLEALALPIHLGLGPGKNRMQQLPIVIARAVTWWAMGRRREVLRLCQRITHVGSWRAAGYGAVVRWEVQLMDPTEHDPTHVLVRDGVAQRHLPAEWCVQAESLSDAPIEPPYWHPARARPRVARAGTRVILTRELIESCYAAADPAKNDAYRQRRDAERHARRARADAAGATEGR